MAHTRIRKFNTKETYPEQNLDNDLCQAVVADRGRTVFVRGQISQSLDTSENIPGDAGQQADQAMRNIAKLMKECGGGMEHVCRVVVYLTDIRYREAVYRAMGEHLKGVYPVSTGLVVSALARPEWVVEIEATAVIPD
jgi:enamine deaminase RidA (YjgF/YER057c/UK114 family)